LVDVFLSRKSERLGKLEYFLLTHRAELWGQNFPHLSLTLGALGRMSLHLSPTLGALGRMILHLSPTCPSHLGALGRMSLHLFSTCLPHLSPTCLPKLSRDFFEAWWMKCMHHRIEQQFLSTLANQTRMSQQV